MKGCKWEKGKIEIGMGTAIDRSSEYGVTTGTIIVIRFGKRELYVTMHYGAFGAAVTNHLPTECMVQEVALLPRRRVKR